MQRPHDSTLSRCGAIALSSHRLGSTPSFLFLFLIDIKYLHILSNFQEHFQHLQHLSIYSYLSGLQKKLPLASLGYSQSRRYNHTASIRQANCFLENFFFKQAKKMGQDAFHNAWPPELNPQNLHGRRREHSWEAVLWPLYAPCSTHTHNPPPIK